MKENGMYLFLGQSLVVPKKSVVGVFDLDNASTSRITRDFLKRSEKAREVRDVSGELPKSFVLTEEGGRRRLYLSQLNSSTLLRRWEEDPFAPGRMNTENEHRVPGPDRRPGEEKDIQKNG